MFCPSSTHLLLQTAAGSLESSGSNRNCHVCQQIGGPLIFTGQSETPQYHKGKKLEELLAGGGAHPLPEHISRPVEKTAKKAGMSILGQAGQSAGGVCAPGSCFRGSL